MTKLTPSARALLEAAKGGDEPTSAARARVRTRLLTQIGAGAAIGAGSGSATAAGAATKAALSTGLIAKVLGVIGVAGVITVGALVVRPAAEPLKIGASAPGSPTSMAPAPGADRSAAPPEAPVTPPTSAETRAPESASAAVAAPSPTPKSAAVPAHAGPRPAASARIAPTPPADGSFEAETSLLEHAQAELREGHPERALAALDARSAEFKEGILGEERLAARILALCNLGRTSEATALAQRFLAASPRSPLAERIRNSCGGERATNPERAP